MSLIYLAGPMQGKTDEEAGAWRHRATMYLYERGHDVLNPMERDYRKVEYGVTTFNTAELVEADKKDIMMSDGVLLNALYGASWGTAMEAVYATQYCRPIVAIHPVGVRISPWLLHHIEGYHPTVEQACDQLVTLIHNNTRSNVH